MQGTVPGAATPLWTTPQTLVFGSNGQLASVNGAPGRNREDDAGHRQRAQQLHLDRGGSPQIDFPADGSENAVTQFADDQTIEVTSQDGNAAGTLESYSIGAGRRDHGYLLERREPGTRDHRPGAVRQSPRLGRRRQRRNSRPRRRPASAQLGAPGTDGLGTLQGGAVEGSNVDLATELTDLIEAQTAYQANTKVVDTTSTALESLVQMS